MSNPHFTLMSGILGTTLLNKDRDTISPGTRARCTWQVTAGVVPGHPEKEYTRRWVVTSETYYAEAEATEEEYKKLRPTGVSTFIEYRDAAYEYAKKLTDPRGLNWVKVDWIYY